MSVMMMAAVLVASAPAPVRDPFWPVGYQGEYRVISLLPRVVSESEPPKPVVKGASAPVDPAAELARLEAEEAARIAAEEEAARRRAAEEQARREAELLEARWRKAALELKVGGVFEARSADGGSVRRMAVINGRDLAVGQKFRTEHDGYRFVWRLVAAEVGKAPRLERVAAEKIEESAKEEE